MSEVSRERRVVAGVTGTQSAVVVQQAARFGRAFGAALVCAHLAHRRPRPVVAVPLAPLPGGSALAWDEGQP
jgi:hypothetical protein